MISPKKKYIYNYFLKSQMNSANSYIFVFRLQSKAKKFSIYETIEDAWGVEKLAWVWFNVS